MIEWLFSSSTPVYVCIGLYTILLTLLIWSKDDPRIMTFLDIGSSILVIYIGLRLLDPPSGATGVPHIVFGLIAAILYVICVFSFAHISWSHFCDKAAADYRHECREVKLEINTAVLLEKDFSRVGTHQCNDVGARLSKVAMSSSNIRMCIHWMLSAPLYAGSSAVLYAFTEIKMVPTRLTKPFLKSSEESQVDISETHSDLERFVEQRKTTYGHRYGGRYK